MKILKCEHILPVMVMAGMLGIMGIPIVQHIKLERMKWKIVNKNSPGWDDWGYIDYKGRVCDGYPTCEIAKACRDRAKKWSDDWDAGIIKPAPEPKLSDFRVADQDCQ